VFTLISIRVLVRVSLRELPRVALDCKQCYVMWTLHYMRHNNDVIIDVKTFWRPFLPSSCCKTRETVHKNCSYLYIQGNSYYYIIVTGCLIAINATSCLLWPVYTATGSRISVNAAWTSVKFETVQTPRMTCAAGDVSEADELERSPCRYPSCPLASGRQHHPRTPVGGASPWRPWWRQRSRDSLLGVPAAPVPSSAATTVKILSSKRYSILRGYWFDDTFSRFCIIPECWEETNGRTGRRTEYDRWYIFVGRNLKFFHL